MRNTIQEAFGQIHATEQMKRNVSGYISQQTGNYANQQERAAEKEHEGVLQKQNTGFFAKWNTAAIRPVFSVCMILILCLGFGGWYYWETPVSYVSIDVNPSIELVLNQEDRVVRVEVQNEDGALVLEHLQLKGKRYLQAVEMLVESDAMRPYLTKDADLTFTVASPKAEELLKALRGSSVTNRYRGLYRQADLETVHLAHACGLSLGKYQIYQKIAQYDDRVTAEDCQHMTMCQLHKTLFYYEVEAEKAGKEAEPNKQSEAEEDVKREEQPQVREETRENDSKESQSDDSNKEAEESKGNENNEEDQKAQSDEGGMKEESNSSGAGSSTEQLNGGQGAGHSHQNHHH